MFRKIILSASFLGLLLSCTEISATGGTGFQEAEEKSLSALEWYEKAAAQGKALKQEKLGGMYTKAPNAASEKNTKPEEVSATNKQEELDELLKMHSKALEWYEKAAARGTAPKQEKLGAMYDQVEDVDKPKEVIHEDDDVTDLYD